MASNTGGVAIGGGDREEESGDAVDGAAAVEVEEALAGMEELSDEDLQVMLQQIMEKSRVIQQRLGAELDPITFVSAQVHVLIGELWPEQRDQTIFGIKVHSEIVNRLEEVGAEIRKQKLVEGVGMTPPRNRAEARRRERGR